MTCTKKDTICTGPLFEKASFKIQFASVVVAAAAAASAAGMLLLYLVDAVKERRGTQNKYCENFTRDHRPLSFFLVAVWYRLYNKTIFACSNFYFYCSCHL